MLFGERSGFAGRGARMNVLTVASQKGGVGKTTVALNLSYAMANRAHRVLLIDCDPQGGVGLSLGRNRRSTRGLAELLARGSALTDVMLSTRLPELSILGVGNIAVEDTLGFGEHLADGRALARLLEEAAAHHDLVVFDTPAGFGGATMGALRVSTHILSTLQAEPIALRSATQMLSVLGMLRESGVRASFLGFVITMLQMTERASSGVAEAAWQMLPPGTVLKTMIPRDPLFLEASASGVPLGLLGARPPACAAVFDQLAAELESHLYPHGSGDGNGPVSLFA